nr:MAG TPA: type I neck protein [Caudoviricetes sp.]
MISFKYKGDFSKTVKYFNKTKNIIKEIDFDKYGEAGVEALKSVTPYDTGLTAGSWYYKIFRNSKRVKIGFYNLNINNDVPIAIILQYGHATKGGGFVSGRDYINPAIQGIFDEIVDNAWKEVTE